MSSPGESPAYLDALRWRSTGAGLVPYDVITQLTPEEWHRVQNMSRTAAGEILKTARMPITQEISVPDLESLVAESKDEA